MSSPTKAASPKSTPSTSDPAPDAPEATTAESASAGEVKYTGGAGVRTITKAQWKGAGVEDQDTVTWDATNDYTVPASKFNQAALDVLKRDPQIKQPK